ncbi:MAG: peptide ABC transporter substrate-binding protein, partial [Ktedonobacteraceae bacterium]
AMSLLQAGMAEEGITSLPPIKITYSTGPTLGLLMTAIRQMWSTVLNVNVAANVEDFTKELGDINQSVCTTPATPAVCLGKGIQMWSIGWSADYPDPQDFTTLQFDNGVANNQANYGQNTALDATTQVQTQVGLEKADAMPAGAARFNAYMPLEQQLVNDVAWLPLYQTSGVEVIKPYVSGWVDNAQASTPPDDWANIFITVH